MKITKRRLTAIIKLVVWAVAGFMFGRVLSSIVMAVVSWLVMLAPYIIIISMALTIAVSSRAQVGPLDARNNLSDVASPATAQANLSASLPYIGLNYRWTSIPIAGIMHQTLLPYACTLPANLTGSAGWSNTVPTSTTSFTIAYIHPATSATPVSIGTASFAASAHAITLPSTSAVNLAAGDIVQITSPNPSDSTAADITITLRCTRTAP